MFYTRMFRCEMNMSPINYADNCERGFPGFFSNEVSFVKS